MGLPRDAWYSFAVIFEFTSYRSFLRATLAERVERNPRYSLRAMAQHLGFACSTLSEVINGKANFSIRSARKLAIGMKLSKAETEYLCLLVRLEACKDPDAREVILGLMRALN